MQISLYSIKFIAQDITIYLWSPWRATALEHRLFDVCRNLPACKVEEEPDEWRIQLKDQASWQKIVQIIARVLDGWKEEANEIGREHRSWYWVIEAETDRNGYDSEGEPSSVWAYIQLGIEEGNPGEEKSSETLTLDGLSFRFWNESQAE